MFESQFEQEKIQPNVYFDSKKEQLLNGVSLELRLKPTVYFKEVLTLDQLKFLLWCKNKNWDFYWFFWTGFGNSYISALIAKR